jgi:protein-tyrosine-phosphatase
LSKNGLLFMCVANSARSQMAEGLARRMAPAGVEVYSAGSAPSRINPYAVRALAAVDVDAAGQHSKGVSDIPHAQIRWVITLCAEEVCPVFGGDVERIHWPHPDPADATGSDAEILASFSTVRDAIEEKLSAFFAHLN